MLYQLTTPYVRPPMTANDQRRAHFQQVRKHKNDVSKAVKELAQAQGIQDLDPSVVTLVWYAPDRRRRDADSLGPFAKAALDGLTQAGAWPDDHSDWVTEVRLRIDKTQTKFPRIEILISEDIDAEPARN